MSESCTMDIEAIEGAKNIFLGGMGLFHTKVTGPGKVYLQTMPIIKTAKAIEPYMFLPDSGTQEYDDLLTEWVAMKNNNSSTQEIDE